MPAKRSAMRKIKDVLRLKFEAKLSHERIAAATGISKGAVSKYVQRALQKGLGWPLPADLDDGQLEAPAVPPERASRALRGAGLCPRPPGAEAQRRHAAAAVGGVPTPRTASARTDTANTASTITGTAAASRARCARCTAPGEKLFIDYSGDTAAVIDMATGEVRTAQIFVAVMGASKYAYAEATWTQTLPDWIASNIRALEFMNGAPALLIPDNLKSAIKNACRYEPEATSTYEDFARHYGTAILPARPLSPKDKASVEMSVLVVQRWILARLRNRQFFSLVELNIAIAELLVDLNRRPFKKLPGCRAAGVRVDRPTGLEAAARHALRIRRVVQGEGRTSTTTSMSSGITTAFRTRSSVNTSWRVTPTPRSSASTRAAASPCTCAVTRSASSRRSLSTCRNRTKNT